MARRLGLGPACRLAHPPAASSFVVSSSTALVAPAPPTRRPVATAARPAGHVDLFGSGGSSPTTGHETSTRAKIFRDFQRAVERQSAPGVRRTYPRLIASVVLKTGDTARLDEPAQRRCLADAMRLLVQSSDHNTGDYELVWRIFEDLQRVFLSRPTLDDCSAIIAAMVQQKRLREAYQWLKAMPAVYKVFPTVREWNIVLAGIERDLRHSSDHTDGLTIAASGPSSASGGAPSQGEMALLKAVYDDMLDSGVHPDIVSYNTLLAFFAAKGDASQLRAGLEDMKQRGLAPNAQTYAIQLRSCIAVGDLEGARHASRSLLARPVSEDLDVDAWNSLLLLATLPAELRAKAATATAGSPSDTVIDKGPEAVLDVMRERGIQPNEHTVNDIIRSDTRPITSVLSAAEIIDRAETLTGVSVDGDGIGIIVRRFIGTTTGDQRQGVMGALAIYREAVKSRAVVTSNDLALPILRGLASLGETDADVLVAAKELYAAVQAAYENGNTAVPSIDVYRELLHVCASSTAAAQWAEVLLADMKKYQHKLPMDAVLQLAGPIMRVSPDYDAAFRILMGFHTLDPRAASTASAEALLDLFLSVPVADGPAPYEKTTQVVQQMRFVSAFLGTDGYRSLFRHYAGDNASGQPSAVAVQRFHTILSLDRYYDPETPVFNELIRAYGLAGAYDAAWGVWEAMLVTPQRAAWDDGTIVAVLDLCCTAVGGEVLDPRPVWTLARTREANDPLFRLSKAAWDAWVGALARLGSAQQMDYAADVVIGQMARGQSMRPPLEGDGIYVRARPPPSPDRNTLDMLIRYAHAKGGQSLLDWLRKRLQREVPQLWPDVAEVERFEWDAVRDLRERCSWPDYGDEPWIGTEPTGLLMRTARAGQVARV